MPSNLDEKLPPGQPALVLLYGTTSKKYRPLDRDVMIIGRARGCDLSLDAHDVSSVHCVLSRGPGGFRVRDSGSRAGTRLNGEPVEEAALHDEDVLQVGPFSFCVHLPAGWQPAERAGAHARLQHLERSRRNLARLALAQRRRLGKKPEAGPGADAAGAGDEELRAQLAALQQRVRDYDDRVRRLEEAEREVARDRELLNRETADLDARAQNAEEEAARRRAEAEADLARRREEYESACRAREQQLASAEEAARAARAAAEKAAVNEEELGRVEGTRRELDERRRLLDERERRLAGVQELVTRGLHEMRHEHAESLKAREEWTSEQAAASDRLAAQRAAIAEAEAALRTQRGELVQMMNELKQLQESLRQQEGQELEALRQENQQLRDEFAQAHEALAERERLREVQRQALAERDQALAECDRLRAEAAPPPQADAASKDNDVLREEITFLRGLLQEKDALLQELQAPRDHPLTEEDMEGYEAELNKFRLQLETDRQKLNKDIQQLRARNTELDEAKRELELDMSKERAELARERIRLERLREEMRLEIERVQREGGVRDRLAPVQRLRDEMHDRRQPPSTPRPGQPAAGPLDVRLRSLRDRISETSS
jgi:hypothetical protein